MARRTSDGQSPKLTTSRQHATFLNGSPAQRSQCRRSAVGRENSTSCSPEARIAAVKKEIATIGSHTAADAAKIPFVPLASR